MKANRVTWIKNLVGNILLMFLVLGLIPVLFCVVLFFNFVNTLIIPQREPNTKYLFFSSLRVLMQEDGNSLSSVFFLIVIDHCQVTAHLWIY